MATKIVTKNSSTASAVPTASDLVQGELAVNVADKRLFTEDNGGSVVELGTNPSSLTVSGNIDVDGVTNLDAVDIDGAVDMASTLQVDGAATFTTEITANGGIALGDNDKATFGASDDLQIYHDGNDSYIDDAGQGSLAIRGSASVSLQNYAGGVMVKGNAGSDTILYHNNAAKLATTSTGIDVTGTATMDGLTVDQSGSGATTASFNHFHANSDYLSFKWYGTTLGGISQAGGANLKLSSTYDTVFNTSSNDRLKIATNGDISFYEDTGTTPKLFWDASAESLGIGTSSPDFALSVGNDSDSFNYVSVRASNTGSAGYLFSDAQDADVGYVNYSHATNHMGFGANGAERMRIDSSGNLLVGKTASDIATSGVELTPNDRSAFTRNSGAPILANRTTSDGEIINLRKDGTTVGSIGIEAAGFTIDGETGHTGLQFGSSAIIPRDNGSNTDGANNLGASVHRFKDLYLSGTAYAGILNLKDGNTNGQINCLTPTGGKLYTNTYAEQISQIQGSEKMRLDSSGNLLVGKSSSNLGVTAGIELNGQYDVGYFTRSAEKALVVNRLSTDGDIVAFRKDGTTVGSISVSSSATSYNTSSDQRLKENIADADDAGSKIDAIQVRKYDWKADGSHQDYGMIAQELLEVAPEAVSVPEDSEEMMGVDYSKLVPMLIKEIQSLRNRVAQLEE